mgnify:CR=1 FL=1
MMHACARNMAVTGCLMVAVGLIGCTATTPVATVQIDASRQLSPANARQDADNGVCWYDARELLVEGKGWTDTETFYDRLPGRAKETVTETVWTRSRHASGVCVRFATDSRSIRANWTVTSPSLAMEHMPASGMSGLDLYVRHNGRWRWLATGMPTQQSNQAILAKDLPPGSREYVLYLPLYNGTESLEIGVDADALLAKPAPRPANRAKPVVFYGTSITHGGCASRPGMSYPAILGRWLDLPVIALGFSGSGKMEPAMADLLAEIDAAAYVLDCLPNMQADIVTERVEPFVHKLRAVRPACPIILVENITYQNSFLVAHTYSRSTRSNQALDAAYQRMKKAGVERLYYLPGDRLLGDDGEATVDGTHPTDLGFLRIAQAIEPVLRSALD